MAITGFAVMTMPDQGPTVQAKLARATDLTFYGQSPDGSLVYVLEAPSDTLETRLQAISDTDGVLTVLPASVNIEDELEAKGLL